MAERGALDHMTGQTAGHPEEAPTHVPSHVPTQAVGHVPGNVATHVSALCTDLYEIRMAVSYLRHDMHGLATFSLFARHLPATRGFLVAAGLDDCLTLLEGFRFGQSDLHYLRHAVGLTEEDLDALARIKFTGDVWAVPEGRVVFGDEPFLEVTAPIAEAQLVETALLNLITFETSVTTKAVRCRLAAPDAELVEFGARRVHGLGAAMSVARCCTLAGFTGTSYVAAAHRYGLRPVGTIAHSYVEAFGDERTAFRTFARDFPAASVFLVDTYDTLAGVRTAIEVAQELGLAHGAIGVRLDSGDLADLSKRTRQLLDAAGLPKARIMASGGLDEYALAALTAAQAPIDMYGVGTKVGVSADAPSLNSAYKLVDYDGRPVIKTSEGKATLPGAKQVYRGEPGTPDLLALRDETPPPDREPLLVPVMSRGERLDPEEDLATARRRLLEDLAWLPESAKRITDPTPAPVHISAALRLLTNQVREDLAAHQFVR